MGFRYPMLYLLGRLGCTGSTRFPFIKQRKRTVKNTDKPLPPLPVGVHYGTSHQLSDSAQTERPEPVMRPLAALVPGITLTSHFPSISSVTQSPLRSDNTHGPERTGTTGVIPSSPARRGSIPSRPPEPCLHGMNLKVVQEVTAIVQKAFGHMQYAVSGLSAMVLYGFPKCYPRKVDIVCPDHAKKVVEGWAMAHGIHKLVAQGPNIYGVTTSEGHVRSVKFRYYRNFDRLIVHKTRTLMENGTLLYVLGLPSIADDIARVYVKILETGEPVRRQHATADLFLWALHKMVDSRRPVDTLNRDVAPHILHGSFWEPFTLAYPASLPLFERAGVRWPMDSLNHPAEEDETDVFDTAMQPNSNRARDRQEQKNLHLEPELPNIIQRSVDHQRRKSTRQSPMPMPNPSLPLSVVSPLESLEINDSRQCPDSGLRSFKPNPKPIPRTWIPVRVIPLDAPQRPELRHRSLESRSSRPRFSPRDGYRDAYNSSAPHGPTKSHHASRSHRPNT